MPSHVEKTGGERIEKIKVKDLVLELQKCSQDSFVVFRSPHEPVTGINLGSINKNDVVLQ